MKKTYFVILIILLGLPLLASGDGGMIIWPPTVHLDQSAQNAMVAWNGREEIIILSVDVEGSSGGTALRIVPLPSNPSEIKEGNFESFERLVEIMNEKIQTIRDKYLGLGDEETQVPAAGIEITFQKRIGAHDVTVVKVNDLNYFLDWIKNFTEDKGFEQKEISSEFKEGVANYLKKDINYFVFDVIETGQEKESIKPLIYRFESDFLYYPILISGISEISESMVGINLFVITEKEIQFSHIPYSYYHRRWFNDYGYPIKFTKEEIEQVSPEIAALFEGEVQVRKVAVYIRLNELNRDFMLFPSFVWNKSLSLGSRGDEVKALQQILINEGLWTADVGATGYFGSITTASLIGFQEKYSQDILDPLNLSSGTGYFGSKTKEYLKRLSLSFGEIELSFSRNLTLGMKGNDVKALQEILIREGVWERPDIGATGYFGRITKTAVIRYQEKYASHILEPLGLMGGTGFVGPSTRTHLER
jgi:peptidoglycan hydrolase-like protein with peptidoglycan-binding domain